MKTLLIILSFTCLLSAQTVTLTQAVYCTTGSTISKITSYNTANLIQCVHIDCKTGDMRINVDPTVVPYIKDTANKLVFSMGNIANYPYSAQSDSAKVAMNNLLRWMKAIILSKVILK